MSRRLGVCNWSSVVNLVTKGGKGFEESVASRILEGSNTLLILSLEGFVCKMYYIYFL